MLEFDEIYNYCIDILQMSLQDETFNELMQVSSICNVLEEAEEDFQRHVKRAKYDLGSDNTISDAIVQRLLNVESTPQRTLEWYKQGLEVLTASQFATILKSPRVRGQLVLEKAKELTDVPSDPPRLCCYSDTIRPFDWGIRFEPIIKQLYESLTKTKLADLGRLVHQTRSNLAASPDGLVVEDLSGSTVPRKGRLVEFKAPITRVIVNDTVPQDYYIQMQIQLEVADVELCDYCELTFVSPYNNKPYVEPSLSDTIFGKGKLYLIRSITTERLLRYEYPPLDTPDKLPELTEDEEIAEIIPWHCTHIHLKTVERSRSWFNSVQPQIESFWKDVSDAKKGLFVLPESSRKKKEVVCQITDSD